jgi:hypothetical protein
MKSRGFLLIFLLLAGVLGVVSPRTNALSVTIGDQPSCVYLGAQFVWSSTNICTLTGDYTINSGDSLGIHSGINFFIDPGVTLTNNGEFSNEGISQTQTGSLVLNYGTFIQNSCSGGGIFPPGGIFYNYGAFANVGSFYQTDSDCNFFTDGTFTNSGMISNQGTIENLHSLTSSGTIVTSGTGSKFMNDACLPSHCGSVDNYPTGSFTVTQGGVFDNEDAFTNEGSLTLAGTPFPSGNSGVLTNDGTWTLDFQYGGTFDNANTINNGGGKITVIGGTFDNKGTINDDGIGVIELDASVVVDNEVYATIYDYGAMTGDYGAMTGDYSGVIVNDGAVYVECGATFNLIGVSGSQPIDFLVCLTTASTTVTSTSTVTVGRGSTTIITNPCTQKCYLTPEFAGGLGFVGVAAAAFVALMFARRRLNPGR